MADDAYDGQAIRRLMFCYRTIGCEHYRKTGGCSMCAFPEHSTLGVHVPNDALQAQLEFELDRIDFIAEGISELDLFCAGSFFNDEEVPPPVRRHAYNRARELGCLKKLLVESRPEYICDEKIEEARSILGEDICFEVAIGLESSNQHVRETIVKKGFNLEIYETAVAALARNGAALLAYVLLKPPGLTERLALEDTEQTVLYVFETSKRLGLVNTTAAIEPTFVQREGSLHELYIEGIFKPPWLWTIVSLLEKTAHLGEIQIGTADDSPPPIASRYNCEACSVLVEAAIEDFNRNQDLAVFEKLTCDCKLRWQSELNE